MDIEYLKEVFGLAANFLLFVTAVAAGLGVVRWSKEHKGRKRIDLAEDVLATAYEVREAITFMRGPFAWDSESKDLVQFDGESDESFRRRKTYSVAYFRYQQHADLFSRLRTLCYRVEAAFGKPHGKPIRTLLTAPSQVINAGNSLGRSVAKTYYASEKDWLSQLEFQRKLEGIFWEFGADTENDTLTPQLDQALTAVEALAQHVINHDGESGEVEAQKTP